MIKEPLKNKMYHNVDIVCGTIIAKRTSCVEEDDVKSAVEWFKNQFEKNKSGSDNIFSNSYIEKKLKEAFPDLKPNPKKDSKSNTH